MDTAHYASHRLDGESVGRALTLLGERWTMLILREAFFGVRRYGQFARNLQIPRPTLSSRLRSLVDAGLLQRVQYAHDPDRYEYRLTDAGRDLRPALLALMAWGDRYRCGADGPPAQLFHEECGAPVHVEVRCAEGHEIGPRTRLTLVPGPGARLVS